MELLTTGQMARLGCVSEKALRLYQKKGILIPAHVNEETGYRYYSYSQCAMLDTILQLQTIGFTLDEIKDLVDAHDPDTLEASISARLELINKQEREIAIAKQTAKDLLKGCSSYTHKPICDQIQLEYLPERRILEFEVSQPPDEFSTLESQWEYFRYIVKLGLMERDYPISMSNYIGSIIPEENLRNGSLLFSKMFVYVNESFGQAFNEATVLPGGQYLTVFAEHCVDWDAEDFEIESRLIRRMLDYAEKKGFEVNGDYFDEGIAGTTALGYRGRDGLFKLNLPVRRADRST